MFRHTLLPALFLVACASLPADVTMRSSLNLKINVSVPGAAPELPFKEIVARIKGDRGYAAMGTLVSVTDSARGEVTLIDTKAQRYAIMNLADYLAKMQPGNLKPPANASDEEKAQAAKVAEAAKQAMANVKFDVESRETGRTDHMGGIAVFEREVVVNMSIPLPVPGQENGMQMMMKFQLWKPAPSELDRVPALRELATYTDRNQGFNNPMAMLQQIFSSMPGMSEGAGKMVEEMKKGGSLTLGMHMGIFMPGLAKMMEQARAQGSNVPDLPAADKPLAELSMDLKELSTDTVPNDVFAVPAGYTEAPAEELVRGMMAAFAGAKQ